MDLVKQGITDAHIERLAERAKRTTSVTDWIIADNPLVRVHTRANSVPDTRRYIYVCLHA